jgi:hypothetical protein
VTLKPIPGAPIGAPIPDFPTGKPGPLVIPASRITRRPVEPRPLSLPSSAPSPPLSPARRPGPVELRGSGDSALTFRCIPEVPDSPIVIADSRSGSQVEFAIAEDGPAFTVGKPGQQRTSRRFNAGQSYDVKTMAAHLLADLGP